MYKAMLIDVKNKKIVPVEIKNGIKDIYKHLDCSCFTAVPVSKDVCCYVDDESLLKTGYIDEDGERHNLSGFMVAENALLMGNGLLVGSPDEEGETTDFDYPVEMVEDSVRFVDFDKEEDRPQPSIKFYSFYSY